MQSKHYSCVVWATVAKSLRFCVIEYVCIQEVEKTVGVLRTGPQAAACCHHGLWGLFTLVLVFYYGRRRQVIQLCTSVVSLFFQAQSSGASWDKVICSVQRVDQRSEPSLQLTRFYPLRRPRNQAKLPPIQNGPKEQTWRHAVSSR